MDGRFRSSANTKTIHGDQRYKVASLFVSLVCSGGIARIGSEWSMSLQLQFLALFAGVQKGTDFRVSIFQGIRDRC